MSVKITQLFSYPIKSCAGIQHEQVSVDALGLAHDRQWMVVDENGTFLSQRKHPKMALIQPHITTKGMALSAPGKPTISLQHSTKTTSEVTVWKDTLQADVASDEVNQWLSDFLAVDVRLVHYGADSFRQIDLDYARAGQAVAFADGYPILVTHEASLEQLNQQLSSPVGMERFRPNIVVSSDLPAWSELHWQGLVHEASRIQLVKPCARCVMTGVDQAKGIQTGTEVLKTLGAEFAHQNKAVFGINGLLDDDHNASINLSVGQLLEVQ